MKIVTEIQIEIDKERKIDKKKAKVAKKKASVHM